MISIKLGKSIKLNAEYSKMDAVLKDINDKAKKLMDIYNDLTGKEGTPNKMDTINTTESPQTSIDKTTNSKATNEESSSSKPKKALTGNDSNITSGKRNTTIVIDSDDNDNDIDMEQKEESLKRKKRETHDDDIIEEPSKKRRKLNSQYNEILKRFGNDDDENKDESSMPKLIYDNDSDENEQQENEMNTNNISQIHFMEIKKNKFIVDPPKYTYDSISKEPIKLGSNENRLLNYLNANDAKDQIDENQINRWVKHAAQKKNTSESKSIADLVVSYKKRQKTIKKPSNLLMSLEQYMCKMIYGDANEKNTIVNERYQKDYCHYCTYINSLLLRIGINHQIEKDIKKFVVEAQEDKKDSKKKLKNAKKKKISNLKSISKDASRCIAIYEKQLNEIHESNTNIISLVKKTALNGCYICGQYMHIYTVASMGQHVPNCLKKMNT